MTMLPLALAFGGSALSGLFGGGGDPGPSGVLQNSRKDVLGQSDRFLDAFYGQNWRNSLYGDPGINAQIDGGDGTVRAGFRYGQGAGGAGTTSGSRAGGATPFGNAPILSQMYAASRAGIGENARTLNDYNQGAEAGYREAAQYGTGQNAVIESDANKSLQDANAISLARLNGMGLGGSTIATDAMGANASSNLREKSRAKANVADQATGLRLQQRNQATTGRAALQSSLNSSNQNLRMMPIQGQLGALGSNVVNPYSVSGGSAPQGPQNGALANVGNLASNLGGLWLANSLYNGAGSGTPDSYDNYRSAGFPRPH